MTYTKKLVRFFIRSRFKRVFNKTSDSAKTEYGLQFLNRQSTKNGTIYTPWFYYERL